jgi:hypothetical protein
MLSISAQLAVKFYIRICEKFRTVRHFNLRKNKASKYPKQATEKISVIRKCFKEAHLLGLKLLINGIPLESETIYTHKKLL